MTETDSKRIEDVRLYSPKLAASVFGRRLRLYHVFFLFLFLYQVLWVLSTVGVPYKEFLEKADREGFAVMEGQTKMRAELEYALGDINDPDRFAKKIGWMDWMDVDIEEHAERKRREKERNVLDSLPKNMRVPYRYAPSFLPSLITGIVAVLYALVLLLQVWSVAFNTWVNFKEENVDSIILPDEMMELNVDQKGKKSGVIDMRLTNVPGNLPTHAKIAPSKGRHVLVRLDYYPSLGMTFEYHRRRYAYDTNASLWTKIRCRTDIPLSFWLQWEGFRSEEQLLSAFIRYGPNKFAVRQPTFMELYKAQLLSPFTVFQLFCVILWMLDDYWQYSFFTLFMILTFEGTVVFQRIKSQQALTGMGNKARPVWVFRSNEWTKVDTTALLPGDLMSLTRVKPKYAEQGKKRTNKVEDDGGDIVPADLLLLRGSTVVNEASLTGESVPQMKERLSDFEGEDNLAMKTVHKSHVMYAGTKMLQCQSSVVENDPIKIPQPPDHGSLCFVLRTGFASAQGKLVRMIEGSQEKVKGHEKETGLLLLLLFFFALASSSYVLYHGLQSDKRSQYELLLHCILILTSVIPPELPMQMALAVNNSLMTLMKLNIFCTEPFRVPIAGKLDSCLFDKTGTLTTDELVAVGVMEPSNLTRVADDGGSILTPMTKVDGRAALVIAGCHSLVYFEGETTGDPLELAALKAMRWGVSSSGSYVAPEPATGKKEAGRAVHLGGEVDVSSVEVTTRHHFSSKLQRMSCVVRSRNTGKHFVVAKGSPEAIGKLLASKPRGYAEKADGLAKQGYRVIALGTRILSNSEEIDLAKDARASCENGLVFAGFIAFTCRVRKDTADVIKRLKEGGMSIAMVTGDSILTAIHVAKEVGICSFAIDQQNEEDPYANETNEELKALLEQKRAGKGMKRDHMRPIVKFKPVLILDQDTRGALAWKSYEDNRVVEYYDPSLVEALSRKNDLAVTGKVLAVALANHQKTADVLGWVRVFARMAPDAKETVIESLHGVGALCLMCGDGANDVGALKQADVGVALLTGFGDINVDKGEDGAKKDDSGDNGMRAIMTQDDISKIRELPVGLIKMKLRSIGCEPNKYPDLVEKEDLVKLYQIKAREVAVKRHDKKNALDKKKMSRKEQQQEVRAKALEKQQRMMERVKELEAQGESWATFKAMKEFAAEEMEEAKRKKGNRAGVEGSAAAIAAQFEDMDSGELPMVKLGDASIAAPFTSKIPSIRSCVDIVRQGRCTLVSSIQMYQILALNCLISSYSLSVLYLDGIKYGDTQMTAMGLLGSISFMSVSRSKPLDKLSSVRPLTSIFHPAMFVSLLGQFAIHLLTMYLATQSVKSMFSDTHEVDLDGQFKPSLLNTVVFLVNNVQSVTVFVVNLQGRPFMTGLTENRPLLWSLLATFILTFMFASESVPSLNKYFQLVPFPDDEYRDYILKMLVADVVGSFLLDRVLKLIFAPKILIASIEGTTLKDVFGLSRTVGVIFFLMWTFLGNEEQWEELMLQEGRMDELGLNVSNFTNATNMTAAGAALEAVACVGEACKKAGVEDEF